MTPSHNDARLKVELLRVYETSVMIPPVVFPVDPQRKLLLILTPVIGSDSRQTQMRRFTAGRPVLSSCVEICQVKGSRIALL